MENYEYSKIGLDNVFKNKILFRDLTMKNDFFFQFIFHKNIVHLYIVQKLLKYYSNHYIKNK